MFCINLLKLSFLKTLIGMVLMVSKKIFFIPDKSVKDKNN